MLVRIPLPSVILLPCFKYNPLPREPNPLPLYGLKYNPSPSVSILAIIPPLLRYNPLPNNLLTPVDANPERAPVAKAGTAFFATPNNAGATARPTPANTGNKAPKNPPCVLTLCFNCLLLILIVKPFPCSLAFSNLFICALVKNMVWSPSKSSAPIFILVAAQLAFIACRSF